VKKDEFLKLAKEISEGFKNIPFVWDGRQSILEMKESSFPHWKQMEWIGWYFQFLCEKFLKDVLEIPGPKFGNVRFDGFKEIPWDFKAHAINTSSHQIIVNDSEATKVAIKNYGCVGLILALGKVKYNDDERTFQRWHEELKGGKSNYEIERIKRGGLVKIKKSRIQLTTNRFHKN
jgi:hypothetical protein